MSFPLGPLAEAVRRMPRRPLIHAGDTPFAIFYPDRRKTKLGRLWTLVCG